MRLANAEIAELKDSLYYAEGRLAQTMQEKERMEGNYRNQQYRVETLNHELK